MEKEQHESILNELLSTELDHTRKTEILQELRVDNADVNGKLDDLGSEKERLQKNNDDLVISNSQLFRQLGTNQNTQEENQEQEQKDFSETVTIDQLEGDA